MASVALDNIEKRYGDTHTIKGVSIDIADGEFVVLVGPSGCGKSTLLRMIAGLEDISGGELRIDGARVNDLPAKSRDIAMVFQNYALYPHMTVFDNMAFSMKMRGVDKARIASRVQASAEILGLQPYLKRYPKQLSGGQRQRVAMGRALVRDPKVFLFDEPLSNLDAKLRVQMRAEIKSLHQRLKCTTVYVTHDQIEAMTMADKIVVLQDGVVEQIGAPLALYDAPANLFVATFLGSPTMNLVRGAVREDGGGLHLAAPKGARLPLPEAARAHLGRDCVYGIRPEHLAPADDGIAMGVSVVEPTGAEVHVGVELHGQPITWVSRERVAHKPGDAVRLAPRPDRVHLFDAASGQRLAL